MSEEHPKVVIVDPVDAEALAAMQARWQVFHLTGGDVAARLRDHLPDAEALVLRSGIRLTAELLACARRLKVIVRGGSGTDNIDLDAVASRGIPLYCTPEASSQSVAELGVALILASLRHVVAGHNSLVAGKWEKDALWGEELSGKCVGLVGFGRIGRRLARLLSPFGVELVGVRRRVDGEAAAEMHDGHVRPVSFAELLAISDIISIQVPLTVETRGMFGPRAFGRMVRRPYLVNLGRWDVIDTGALLEALRGGAIRGVAIDPVEPERLPPELTAFPSATLLPHLGAQTREAQARAGAEIVRLLARHLDVGRDSRHSVTP